MSWVILPNTAMWTPSPHITAMITGPGPLTECWTTAFCLKLRYYLKGSSKSQLVTNVLQRFGSHNKFQTHTTANKKYYRGISYRFIITSGISPAPNSTVHKHCSSNNKGNTCVAPASSSMYQQFTTVLQKHITQHKITIRHVLVAHLFISRLSNNPSQSFLNLPTAAWTMRRLSTRPFNFALS